MEQYEAQIISALAPGFDIEAAPEITIVASQVGSYFLCSGLIQNVSSFIRPVKLISQLLEQFIGSEPSKNGRSPNAQAVVKLAVLSAWANLYSNIQDSAKKTELFSIHLDNLVPLWIQMLKDYALLGDDAEQESIQDNGPRTSLYGTATKDITLHHYKSSWISVLSAVTDLIDEKAPSTMAIFPDQTVLEAKMTNPSLYTILGLCVEYLTSSAGMTRDSIEIEKSVACLIALQKLTTLRVLGPSFLDEDILMEILAIFDRLSQTEDVAIQSRILDWLLQFIDQYGKNYFSSSSEFTISAEFTHEKYYRFLRVAYNGLANYIPGWTTNPIAAGRFLS